MTQRRGPWLSGMIIAMLGGAWMMGRVLGGLVGWAAELLATWWA